MKNKIDELESLMNRDLALDISSYLEFKEHKLNLKDNKDVAFVETIGVFGSDSLSKYIFNAYLEDIQGDPEKLILYIDSPGGDVNATLLMIDSLKKYKEAHQNTKVIAYINEIATSAAYWLASFADEIYLNEVLKPVAKIGSVGVKSIRPDLTKYFEEKGIKHNAFVSSSNKFLFDSAFSLTNEQKETLQQRTDELALLFFQDVAKNRGLPVEEVKGWDAKVFNGIEALSNKLIDGFTTIDQLQNDEKKENASIIANINNDNYLAKSDDSMDIKELQDQVKTLTEQLTAVNKELDSYKAKEKDATEKAALVLKEKEEIQASLDKLNQEKVEAKRKDVLCSYQAFFGDSMENKDAGLYSEIAKTSDVALLDRYLEVYTKHTSLLQAQGFTNPAESPKDEEQTKASLEEEYIARHYKKEEAK